MKHAIHPLSRAVAAGFILSLRAIAIEAPDAGAPPPPQVPSQPQGGLAHDANDGSPAAAPAAPVDTVAYLGIGTSEVPGFLGKHIGLAPHTGLLLRSLDPESPAAKAGFTEDDVISKVDGKDVATHRELAELVRAKKPGDAIRIDYIHEGKAGNRSVVLGEHHGGQAFGGEMPDAGALKNMLDNLPADQAKEVREAIERNVKDMEKLQANPAPGVEGLGLTVPGEIKDMEKRMRKMMDGAGAALELKRNADEKGGVQMGFSSTIRLLDNDGSVELRNKDGGNEVRVLDKAGKEVWSGPWDTEQDKAAAPKDIRERIGRLNLDNSFKGNGIRLRGGFGGGVAPEGP